MVAATNQNLEKLVEEGTFREDLYYRINVVTIHLPPLRERREDIPLLAQHFLGQVQPRHEPAVHATSTPSALDLMVRYGWPGNVRELANAVERALVVGAPPTVHAGDLPVRLSENGGAGGGRRIAGGDGEGPRGARPRAATAATSPAPPPPSASTG